MRRLTTYYRTFACRHSTGNTALPEYTLAGKVLFVATCSLSHIHVTVVPPNSAVLLANIVSPPNEALLSVLMETTPAIQEACIESKACMQLKACM